MSLQEQFSYNESDIRDDSEWEIILDNKEVYVVNGKEYKQIKSLILSGNPAKYVLMKKGEAINTSRIVNTRMSYRGSTTPTLSLEAGEISDEKYQERLHGLESLRETMRKRGLIKK